MLQLKWFCLGVCDTMDIVIFGYGKGYIMCEMGYISKGQLIEKIAEYGKIADDRGCMWHCSRGGILPDLDMVDSFLCENYCQRYYRCNQIAIVNDYYKVLDDEDVDELANRYMRI